MSHFQRGNGSHCRFSRGVTDAFSAFPGGNEGEGVTASNALFAAGLSGRERIVREIKRIESYKFAVSLARFIFEKYMLEV